MNNVIVGFQYAIGAFVGVVSCTAVGVLLLQVIVLLKG